MGWAATSERNLACKDQVVIGVVEGGGCALLAEAACGGQAWMGFAEMEAAENYAGRYKVLDLAVVDAAFEVGGVELDFGPEILS
jgi:hypothetical protein